jgi:acylphosphatase
MIERHLIVTGRVQGVGYRDAMRDEAARLGVAGWVRNRRDGTVEALLQGSAPAVEALIQWARRGPPLAHVAKVLVQAGDAQPELPRQAQRDGFERLPTA